MKERAKEEGRKEGRKEQLAEKQLIRRHASQSRANANDDRRRSSRERSLLAQKGERERNGGTLQRERGNEAKAMPTTALQKYIHKWLML